MASQSVIAPRAGTYRLTAIVLTPADASVEAALDPYIRTGVALGVERARCDCSWPACTGDLDEQIEVTMPLIVSQLAQDNANERWEELQALWDLRWARIMSQPDCGEPSPHCRRCGGRGFLDEPFLGAFDFYDKVEHQPHAWAGVLRRYRESPPTWEVPRRYALRFDAYDIHDPDAMPGAELPENPTSTKTLLELCEAGYVPSPALAIGPSELHRRLDWEAEHEWQLRVWELLLAHPGLRATCLRVAVMGRLEQSESRSVARARR